MIPDLRTKNVFAVHCQPEGNRLLVGALFLNPDSPLGEVVEIGNREGNKFLVRIPSDVKHVPLIETELEICSPSKLDNPRQKQSRTG